MKYEKYGNLASYRVLLNLNASSPSTETFTEYLNDRKAQHHQDGGRVGRPKLKGRINKNQKAQYSISIGQTIRPNHKTENSHKAE